jgi:gas vesicle protein
MPRQDTVDFLTAFAVGTVLGIGATLLLQPEPPTARERVVKQLKPYRRRMERSYGQIRGGVREGAGATSDLTGEVIGAGRELLSEFRDEVAKILGDAREELQEMTQEQVRGVTRQAKRTRRKFGM